MRHPIPVLIAIALMIATLFGVHDFRTAAEAQEASPAADGIPASDVGATALDAAFKEALAAGDVDAIAALFAPNGVELNSFGVFFGPNEIRAFGEELIAANPGLSVEFTETEVIANTAVHRMYFSSDPIREMGIDRIVVIHTLVADDGRIVTLTGVLDTTDEQTRQYAMAFAASSATPEATPES